jgi:hypothetical protein
MKNWFPKILISSFLFLLCFTTLLGQNTLDKIGLSNTTLASSAYSLRKMSTSYAGPLARITIGTNYYDVYPDATSGLFALTSKISVALTTYNAATSVASTNALSTIITAGTTNATVAIWYDQSGSANNVIQAITANQPRIINLGTIETLNGMPTLRFSSASSNFMESVNNVSISGASSVNAVSKNVTSSANSANIVTTKGVTAKDGLTAATASTSAYQIKLDFPSSTDGFYWIQNANINGGTAIKIYADMTTNGGGWTLILKNSNTNGGWTYANAIAFNTTIPFTSTADVTSTATANYSIVGWADYIKKSASGFQYMIDANARKSYGGIWTANASYSFISSANTNSNITINTKFGLNGSVGTWIYAGSGIEQLMPYYSNCSGILTTSSACGGDWWGTLVTNGGWAPAPWIASGCGTEGCMQGPGIIWYWVR